MKFAAALTVISSLAWGHDAEPLAPHNLWNAWALEPGIILLLLVAALLYSGGARMSRSEHGANRVLRRGVERSGAAIANASSYAVAAGTGAMGEASGDSRRLAFPDAPDDRLVHFTRRTLDVACAHAIW